jgi:AmiR/NasT family two-component response regulator
MDRENGTPVEHTRRIHQASGMVSVQADCTFDEAVALMRDRATTTGCTLEAVADAVLERTITFTT